jgi:hypothetical protein
MLRQVEGAAIKMLAELLVEGIKIDQREAALAEKDEPPARPRHVQPVNCWFILQDLGSRRALQGAFTLPSDAGAPGWPSKSVLHTTSHPRQSKEQRRTLSSHQAHAPGTKHTCVDRILDKSGCAFRVLESTWPLAHWRAWGSPRTVRVRYMAVCGVGGFKGWGKLGRTCCCRFGARLEAKPRAL